MRIVLVFPARMVEKYPTLTLTLFWGLGKFSEFSDQKKYVTPTFFPAAGNEELGRGTQISSRTPILFSLVWVWMCSLYPNSCFIYLLCPPPGCYWPYQWDYSAERFPVSHLRRKPSGGSRAGHVENPLNMVLHWKWMMIFLPGVTTHP